MRAARQAAELATLTADPEIWETMLFIEALLCV
jgi:hypothetical protein